MLLRVVYFQYKRYTVVIFSNKEGVFLGNVKYIKVCIGIQYFFFFFGIDFIKLNWGRNVILVLEIEGVFIQVLKISIFKVKLKSFFLIVGNKGEKNRYSIKGYNVICYYI